MRILIVSPIIPPEPGGPSYYSVALQKNLQEQGHTVGLLAFRSVRKYPSGIRHLVFLFKVFIAARRAETIIVLDTVSVALPAVLAGWVSRKKVIIRTGGDFVWEQYVGRTESKVPLSQFYSSNAMLSSKERLVVFLQKHVVFRLVDTLVFSTTWQRDLWREPYALHRTKTAVIENAYHVPREKPTRPSGPKTFVWIGRDIPLKNRDVLQAAFADMKKEYATMELVELTGVSQEKVKQTLSTARCLVLPTVSEVSPNIVFESLAFGVPVIATRDMGTKQVLQNAGVLFIEPTQDNLRDSLCTMCDEKEYAVFAKCAHAFVVDRTYADVAREFMHHAG